MATAKLTPLGQLNAAIDTLAAADVEGPMPLAPLTAAIDALAAADIEGVPLGDEIVALARAQARLDAEFARWARGQAGSNRGSDRS